MTDRDRLARLQDIARLIRDRDLAELSQAHRALTAIDRHLAALDVPATAEADPATALARQRYDIWADARRRLLLPERDRLAAARQLAAERASRAFGRAAVLDRLLDRPPGKG